MDSIDVGLTAIERNNLVEQYLMLSLSDWRIRLANECCCFVCDDQYLCKKFDQINFNFCTLKEAEEIATDNAYCLLRYKYLTRRTDDVEKRIQEIVKSFTANLKTSLLKLTLRTFSAENCKKIRLLGAGEVAFHNGVYDFTNNRWLFKYNETHIGELQNNIYEYNFDGDDPKGRVITWYFNFNFTPLDIDINQVPLQDFLKACKLLEKHKRNLCFELIYNMSHDLNDVFDYNKFTHICEIIGYLLDNKPVQSFVMFIGSGQNGKNSLIDGCFTKRVFPAPINNSLAALEDDKFVGGTLVNRYHNIYLETSSNERTYRDNTNLKELTGGTEHTVEKKGENKFPTYINCKFLFSANDQDKIKFSDNTEGFRRRINMLELYYHWDKEKKFLTKGDYYDTTFGNDLEEITNDIDNTIFFIYFGMYGLKSATKNFEKNQFEFTENDWKETYMDVDFDLKESVDMLTMEKVAKYLEAPTKLAEAKTTFFDMEKKRLYESESLAEIGYTGGFKDMVSLFKSPENYIGYFVNNDVYMSVKVLKDIIDCKDNGVSFTSELKKIYKIKKFESLYNNRAYVKVNFSTGKIRIIGE